MEHYNFRKSGKILVRWKRRESRNNTALHPGKMESSTLSTYLKNLRSLFHFLSPKCFGLSNLQRLWLLAPGLLQRTSLTLMYLELNNQSVISYTTCLRSHPRRFVPFLRLDFPPTFYRISCRRFLNYVILVHLITITSAVSSFTKYLTAYHSNVPPSNSELPYVSVTI